LLTVQQLNRRQVFRPGGAAGTDLQLADCRKVGPDVLLLTYRPAARPDER
jgi:hypothetical protein